jgi:predicted ArsR family transcriptional regulator
MGGPSDLDVRDALIRLGWPAAPAHFLALLLTRGEVSTSQAMEATGCTLQHMHRMVRDLDERGLVEAWKGPSTGPWRAMNVYRLRRPKAFLNSILKQARRTVKTLEQVELPKMGTPTGQRRGKARGAGGAE